MMLSEIIDQMNYAEVMGLKIREQHKNTVLAQIKTLFDPNKDLILLPGQIDKNSVSLELLLVIPNDFRTFNGYKPKSQTFYHNYCVLELLRIYYNLHNGMCDLEPIYQKMKARFITTSYKDDSTTGEGIESLIAALRTMSLVFPSECEWIDFSIKKITVFIVENEEAVSPQSKLYFLQTLNEIEAPVAQSAIEALSTSIGDLVSTVAKTKGTYREINETILSNMMGTLNTDTCITA